MAATMAANQLKSNTSVTSSHREVTPIRYGRATLRSNAPLSPLWASPGVCILL
jgi:hypothetical protein